MTSSAAIQRVDVAVVGAGIVGLGAAREISRRRPGARIVVLEREDEIGAHQTGHNSGVIHAGIYYRPGSLKARLCREGADELYAYCDAHRIRADRGGKLIVALDRSELPALDELERRARANGVPGVRRLTGEEIPEIEPHVRGTAALHSPATGVVDFREVARAFAADLREHGAEVRTRCPVLGLEEHGQGVRLRVSGVELEAATVVACAGAWSDRLATAAGDADEPRILPFRGAWLRLRPGRRDLIRSMVYPVPDPGLPFLGVHFTRGVDGEVLIGPTALLVAARDGYSLRRFDARDVRSTLGWPGTYRMARRWWRTGARELHHALRTPALVRDAQRYVPDLRLDDVLPGPAGVRAQAVGRDGALVDDFVVRQTARTLHVRNAPSPAATSVLALARLIADRVPA